jgi:hypothetical protein
VYVLYERKNKDYWKGQFRKGIDKRVRARNRLEKYITVNAKKK